MSNNKEISNKTILTVPIFENKLESMRYYSRNDEKFQQTCLKNRLKSKNKKK